MATRLAHRPRYRNMQHIFLSSLNARQKFFAPRWTYRRNQPASFEKHAPGYSLSLIPLRYRLASQLIVYQI